MRRLLVLMACAGALSGCVTAEQVTANDQAVCNSYGLTFGSRDFYDCMVQRENARREAIQAALRSMPPPQPVPVYQIPTPQPQSRPTNCISNVVGGYVYTNCN